MSGDWIGENDTSKTFAPATCALEINIEQRGPVENVGVPQHPKGATSATQVGNDAVHAVAFLIERVIATQ